MANLPEDSSHGISYTNQDDTSLGLSLATSDPEAQKGVEILDKINSKGVQACTSAGCESNAGGKSVSKADSNFPVPVGDVTCWRNADGISSFLKLSFGWLLVNKSQILSGLTVALAQVPEAVSFSFVAGVEPIVGLHSAWIIGICTSLFGGRPGMVAGATGAVAVVLPSIVEKHGIGYMFYAIMLAGILQMAFGLFRLGVLVRMIPHPVMVGFCNGLGIVIGVAQFNIFKVRPVDEDRRLFETFGAFAPFTNGWDWIDSTMAGWMIFHIVIALLTYALFPKLTNSIPASLASIIMTTIFEHCLVRPVGYRTNTVSDLAEVSGTFPVPVWTDTKYNYKDEMPPLNGETLGIILPVAITAAAIGLLESLLTLELIDEMTNTKGNGNREAFGQGLGQFMSAVLGGMGGCTTIGQSMMNLHSGGYTRLSSSVAATFMLIIILAAYPLINLIPVAGLAGVMFVVTYFTIEWESAVIILGATLPQRLRKRFGFETKVKRSDVFIMLIVVAVTLILDLAIAVAVGIALSCFVFVWDIGTKLRLDRTISDDGNGVIYSVAGPIFFGSIKPLMDLFPDPRSEPKTVTVLFHDAEIHDWSGMMAIKRLHERFENNGTKAKFQKLNVASRRLLQKSKDLWEEIDIFEEEEVNVENDPLVKASDNMHSESHM